MKKLFSATNSFVLALTIWAFTACQQQPINEDDKISDIGFATRYEIDTSIISANLLTCDTAVKPVNIGLMVVKGMVATDGNQILAANIIFKPQPATDQTRHLYVEDSLYDFENHNRMQIELISSTPFLRSSNAENVPENKYHAQVNPTHQFVADLILKQHTVRVLMPARVEFKDDSIFIVTKYQIDLSRWGVALYKLWHTSDQRFTLQYADLDVRLKGCRVVK